MKITTKKGLALACTTLMLAGAAFAQEADVESPVVAEASKKAETKAETKSVNNEISIGMYGKPWTTSYEISLNEADYSNAIPGFWVDFKEIPAESRKGRVKWSSSDMSVVKVDMKGRLWPKDTGKATVTATTSDGKYSTSAEIEVTKFGERKHQPEVGLKMSTDLCGEAAITYAVDLDTGKSGFANSDKVKLKLDLLNIGEVWAGNRYSLPIWGEVRIYTAGDPLKWGVDAGSGSKLSFNDDGDWNDGAFRLYVDSAKIHLGDAFINLYNDGETTLGYVNYTTAPDVCYEFVGVDTDRRYGQLKGQSLQSYLSSIDSSDSFYGLQAGYKMDGIFKVAGDFGSTMKFSGGNDDPTRDTADSTQKYTDWIYKFTAGMYGDFFGAKNLYVEAGVSNGILGKDSVYKQDLRTGLRAEYTVDLGEYFYLKPQVGATLVQLESRGQVYPLAMGSLLFGWAGKQSAFDTWFSGTRPWYLKNEHGAYPGVTVAVMYADEKIAEQTAFNRAGLDTVNSDLWIIHSSFNTGNDLLIKNFEAVGALDVIGAFTNKAVAGASLGLKYGVPVLSHEVVDQNGKKTDLGIWLNAKAWATGYHDFYNFDNDYVYVKAGCGASYDRVELWFNYESNDLVHGFFDKGDGTHNRFGKLETTLKVWF